MAQRLLLLLTVVAPAAAMKWSIDHNLDEVQALVLGGRLSLDFGPAKYAHEVMLFSKNWVDLFLSVGRGH
jgi:hypothetical protein